MPVVWTIKENCRRCYSCIRECPAKAIKVEQGQASVLPERCVGCGHCVKVCSQEAKEILSGIENTNLWLRKAGKGSHEVVALMAPSFPAAFPDVDPGKVISALRAVGFTKIIEVAVGADLINLTYKQIFENPEKSDSSLPIITSTCPAIIEYIEKYVPELIPNLAKIVSPMVATGKIAKKMFGTDSKVVFIGPCIAKKKERQREDYQNIIDEVLTFQELSVLFDDHGIQLDTLEESHVDPPYADLGKIYPISGGLIRSADIKYDILDDSIIFTEGKQRLLNMLDNLKQGRIKAKMVDLLFCEGCISGPAMANDLDYFTRKEKIIDYTKKSLSDKRQAQDLQELFNEIVVATTFSNQNQRLEEPDEEDIIRILQRINKVSEKDELNCGACGYTTCREYATAMYKGLAEEEMCLPYLIDKLESTHLNLQRSMEELRETQHQLIQSEKLASVGQLAAGVAHEVNNPLSSIILYAHLLLDQLKENQQEQEDLKVIIDEATRCKNIVSGLLDFARQGKLKLVNVDMSHMINSAIKKIRLDQKFSDITMIIDVQKNCPEWPLDEDQFTQVLINLLQNSADALKEVKNDKKIKIKCFIEDSELNLIVEDNGCGISEEHINKIFTPFFTTKKTGEGTGLGLPIVYGIVKMHKGSIVVNSKENEGTKVKIKIPKL
ncbi:MAG: hypothetical protein Kow00108_04160 [Calditrichia bacterium]